ncbi:glycosyltransferase family 39 protein [Ferrimonas lipolytica]|uniref:Glycosyltransferase family 39 protein n=2 Tax=Ferrimonas lipolytica TaxID=2724191 RepID=A0A6H1UJJ6_9GAMM|nr:glycosyltransferase family 39 protein [Ferrimonas lipolytica]
MDTTEARYGNMARIMAETGNWLTPMFDYGIPFWGKPPLHTWASAVGIELFGLSEFAVRVPHFIAGLLVLGLVMLLARQLKLNPLMTGLVLATTLVFSLAAGAVMTDMLLTLGMTLAMVGFYIGWQQQPHSRSWSYAAFVGLAIGLLAKGPVVIVLFGLAIVPWLLWQVGPINGFKQLWLRHPIVSGLSLMLVIVAPWYIMAELATPGFLEYFLLGEHFFRFVDAGWAGDLYGKAHDQPRGMIWLFFAGAAMPWTPVLLWFGIRALKQGQRRFSQAQAFLLCWMLAPLVLFTFAGNILPAYVLPGIPALALLVTAGVQEQDLRWLGKLSMVTPLLLLIAIIVVAASVGKDRSDKLLLANVEVQTPVYYIDKSTFSGRFYSDGRALKIERDELVQQATNAMPYAVVVNAKRGVPQPLQRYCEFVDENDKRALYHCDNKAPQQ